MMTTDYSTPQSFKASALTTGGSFRGLAAPFGTPVRSGYVLDYGSFTKSILDTLLQRASVGNNVLYPLLWMGDDDNPIGGITQVREDSTGLIVDGFFDLDIAEGQRAYSAVKAGYVRGLAVGYNPVTTYVETKSGATHITEARLWAVSLFNTAYTPETQVSEIKTLDDQEENEQYWLRRIMALLQGSR